MWAFQFTCTTACISPSICSTFSKHCQHTSYYTSARTLEWYSAYILENVYLPCCYDGSRQTLNTVSTNVYRIVKWIWLGENESDLLRARQVQETFPMQFSAALRFLPSGSMQTSPISLSLTQSFQEHINQFYISCVMNYDIYTCFFSFAACRKLENHPDGQFITFHFHFNFSTIR